MITRLLPHEIVYFVTVFVASAVFLFAWPRRHTPGGTFFIGHLIALLIWVIGLFFEAASIEASTKIFWSQLSYFGVVSVSPFLFLFVLAYTTQHKISRLTITSLFIIPLIVLIGAWTNPLHHLLWSGFRWGSTAYNVLIYEHGFMFYMNVVYIYCLIFLGVVILLRKIFKSMPPFRSQLIVILIGTLFPMISGSLYIFNIDPIPGMDTSAFGFLITNLVLTFGFIRYQLLDLVPVARDMLIEGFHDGMLVLDWQKRIAEINPNAKHLLGLSEKNYLGEKIETVIPWKIDLPALSASKTLTEFQLDEAASTFVDLQVSSLTLNSSSPPGYLLVFRDISARKDIEIKLQKANADLYSQINEINRLQELLQDQATHDSLTGLFNRRLMDEILTGQLAQAKRANAPFSIAVLDIDFFKRINDHYGHQTGDIFLEEYGKCILSSIRKGDFACRLGGDEFLIAFPNMEENIAFKKADDIRQKLHEINLLINSIKISTTVSIGIATFPGHGQSITELISASDQALYKAKDEGRNNVQKASTVTKEGTPRIVE